MNTQFVQASNRGAIYVAIGSGYLNLAEQSARSLLAHNKIEVDLYTDIDYENSDGLFSRVNRVLAPHARSKIDCIRQSRFNQTLYLDCDTLVLREVTDVFGLLKRFDLCICHDVRRRSKLAQACLRNSTPYAFPQMNSGVMFFSATRDIDEVFTSWSDRYKSQTGLRDQPILKDLLWEKNISFYILPEEYNLRRVTIIDAWEPLDALPAIIHSHRLLQHLDGKERVSTVEDLVRLERLARLREWESVGIDLHRDLKVSDFSRISCPEVNGT